MILLGIDFGEKNMGVAFSKADAVAPIKTITNTNELFAIQEIAKFAIANKVEKIVIGLPLSLDGKETSKSKRVQQFGKKVKIITKKPIVYQNEFGTSKDATKEQIAFGVSKRARQLNDMYAAAIILKMYLEEKPTS